MEKTELKADGLIWTRRLFPADPLRTERKFPIIKMSGESVSDDSELDTAEHFPDTFYKEGLPADLQREIYSATLPIFEEYLANENEEMSRDRILGLAVEAMREAWISAKPEGTE